MSNTFRISGETESDPSRQCSAVKSDGTRCRREIYAEGCTCCIEHGGSQQLKKMQRQDATIYKLGVYQQRFTDMFTAKKAKTARDEVALLRMTLEEVVTKFEQYGITSILGVAPQIKDMCLAIGRLLETSQRIELNSEAHVGKAEIVAIATGFIQIISKYVEDEELLNRINEDFVKLIDTSFRTQEDPDADAEDD